MVYWISESKKKKKYIRECCKHVVNLFAEIITIKELVDEVFRSVETLMINNYQ